MSLSEACQEKNSARDLHSLQRETRNRTQHRSVHFQRRNDVRGPEGPATSLHDNPILQMLITVTMHGRTDHPPLPSLSKKDDRALTALATPQ